MHKKKNINPDEPKPLNFDHDEESDLPFSKIFMTSEDVRGDNEDDEYYEREEAMSPEEVQDRKEEGD